jgi:triosephosphate isomerase
MSYFVLGNWKSNGTKAMIQAFSADFQTPNLPIAQLRTGIAPPIHLIAAAAEQNPALWLGAQNCSPFPEGAYTGELTATMLTEIGCGFCLVGHSERRNYFRETVEQTGAKLGHLDQAGITPVFCIGESLEQRKAGELEDVLTYQLTPLRALRAGTAVVVAYEPVWAIGTGVAAKPEDVRDAHQLIATHIESLGLAVPPILYGGSVKPANAAELAAIPKVDGFLVGGASLKAADFNQIVAGFITGKGIN